MVLVRHLTLPYEVRPFIRRCGNVACNCAVAIRSGDDIILIDSCGPRDAPYAAGTLVVRFYLNGDLTPGTSLHQLNDGLKYEVMVAYVYIWMVKGTAAVSPSLTHWRYFHPALSHRFNLLSVILFSPFSKWTDYYYDRFSRDFFRGQRTSVTPLHTGQI